MLSEGELSLWFAWAPCIRTLEWVAMPFSRGSSWPRDQIQVSCIAGIFSSVWATREAQKYAWKNPFGEFGWGLPRYKEGSWRDQGICRSVGSITKSSQKVEVLGSSSFIHLLAFIHKCLLRAVLQDYSWDRNSHSPCLQWTHCRSNG